MRHNSTHNDKPCIDIDAVHSIARRKCKTCKNWFNPTMSIQPTCDTEACKKLYIKKVYEKNVAKAIAHIKRKQAERDKQTRAQHKARKQALKTKGEWLKEAQAAFNRYIRLRDEGNECISCDTVLLPGEVGGSYDAGHYLSRGAHPELRFDELNCHGQCKKCNRYLSGNIANYRIRLLERVGQKEVERLEGPHPLPWRTIGHYQGIKSTYIKKSAAITRGRL